MGRGGWNSRERELISRRGVALSWVCYKVGKGEGKDCWRGFGGRLRAAVVD